MKQRRLELARKCGFAAWLSILSEVPRVLLIGSHLGYNVESYVKMALERVGWRVFFAGYREHFGSLATPVRMIITRSRITSHLMEPFGLRRFNKSLNQIANDFQPRLVIAIKGEAILPQTVTWISDKIGATTALWCTDDPRYFGSLVKHLAPTYDYVFSPSEAALPLYEKAGVSSVTFLPFACDPSIHRTTRLLQEEMRQYASDVSFVGTYYPNRARVLRQLQGLDLAIWGSYWRISGVKARYHGSVWGPEMVKALNASKITINIHHPTDLDFKTNMRTFEAAGCGAFLLTDHPVDLEEMFQVGKEVICYHSSDEFRDLVRYYLKHEAERQEIARRGQQRAHGDHTYDHRVRRMLQITKMEIHDADNV
jgi:spore maturation protein CgeB